MAGATGELRGVSFISTVNHEGPPACLVTSERPHLPRRSPWVSEFHVRFGETALQATVCYLPSPPRDSKALERLGSQPWSMGHPVRLLVDRLPWEAPSALVPAHQLQGRRPRAWLCAMQIWPGREFVWGTAAVSKAGEAARMAACPRSVRVTWSPTGSVSAQPLDQFLWPKSP